MGKGICADCYVGNRRLQELFRLEMGGSSELPIDIRRRLDSSTRPRRRQKKNKHAVTDAPNQKYHRPT